MGGIKLRVFCCKDCTERHINCHSYCEKYLTEKNKNATIKANVSKIKEQDYYFNIGRKSKTNKHK